MAAKYKKTRSYYVLLAGILALLIVGSFVAYQIYSALTKSQVTERQQLNITPLDGVIEPTIIDNLSSRRVFGQTDFNKIVLNRVTPTPTATESGGVSGP